MKIPETIDVGGTTLTLRSAVKQKTSARLDQHRAGREAASELLRAFGLAAPLNIASAPSGAPLFPASIKGSISHTVIGSDAIGVAVGTNHPDVLGVGVDIEENTRPISPAAGRRIASREEWDGIDPERILTVFSIKESFYKAAFPLVGRFINFGELCVGCDLTLTPAPGLLPEGGTAIAYRERCGELLITAVVIR